ncbi:tryptophan synthase subunit alpha [Candidatus Sumerlaeota bacterium]|nr:tryptophan synthase subunit alpha [Candidatus Sumerlaeota bacterium]
MNRIERMFQEKRQAGQKALVLFITAGYPSLDFTKALLPKLAEWGCDLVELGVPFSDPIADGPTIQYSSNEALKAGVTVRKILSTIPPVRERSEVPVILFSAVNPLLKYGLEAIADDAKAAGADGFLIPDVPLEEGDEARSICSERELSLVFLTAPTSPVERLRRIAEASTGFIYYIAQRGVTGARTEIAADLADKIGELRGVTDKPVAVGFGVSTPEHARQVAQVADGVIVGSALINKIREAIANGADSDEAILAHLEPYVRSLAEAL